MSFDRQTVFKIAGAVLIPNLGGLHGSHITRKAIDGWYKNLKFPSYRPPNWIFAPVWTSLYSGMGYASYLVWRDGGGFGGEAQIPLILYATQLILNWAWTPLFFGKKDLKMATHEIVALTITAAACGASFYKINHTAGYIFIPYVAWLIFASKLCYDIYTLNKDEKQHGN